MKQAHSMSARLTLESVRSEGVPDADVSQVRAEHYPRGYLHREHPFGDPVFTLRRRVDDSEVSLPSLQHIALRVLDVNINFFAHGRFAHLQARKGATPCRR
jgi:hypothetical protein